MSDEPIMTARAVAYSNLVKKTKILALHLTPEMFRDFSETVLEYGNLAQRDHDDLFNQLSIAREGERAALNALAEERRATEALRAENAKLAKERDELRAAIDLKGREDGDDESRVADLIRRVRLQERERCLRIANDRASRPIGPMECFDRYKLRVNEASIIADAIRNMDE